MKLALLGVVVGAVITYFSAQWVVESVNTQRVILGFVLQDYLAA